MFIYMFYIALGEPVMVRELSVQTAKHAFRQSSKYSSNEGEVSKMPWPPLLRRSFFCCTHVYLIFPFH